MRTFVYHNYNTTSDILIEAEDIIEADKEYEKLTGINPIKAHYISCRVNSKIRQSKEDYETMTIMFDQLGLNDGSEE